jgi:Ca2+-binding RTX toxin-like protein
MANVPGTFTYAPAAGTVLATGNGQVITVAFTPTDTIDYLPIPSTTATINVIQQATTTTLAASAPASAPGQTVMFTATIAGVAPAPAQPTGSVQFELNGQPYGSPVPLSANDTAGAAITWPATGSYTVTAVYSGDANYQSSTSPTVTEPGLGPGVYAIGTTLYVVGANTSDSAAINPVGTMSDGTTGLKVNGTLNGVASAKTCTQAFTAIIIAGYGGNDKFQLASSLTLPTTVAAGNGNDTIQLGGGNNTVSLGNGNDSVSAGGGNNTITVGNGNDTIQLGGGDNVVVEGNGTDFVSAGNGANLIVGGLGSHTIRVGNGTNILSDGSATVVNAVDSFRQILTDWKASASPPVNQRLTVNYNTKYANYLSAGSGRDWFFFVPPTTSNKKSTDRLN